MKLSKPHSFYFASRSNSRYYQSRDDYQYFLSRGDGFLEKLPVGSTPDQFGSRAVTACYSYHSDKEKRNGDDGGQHKRAAISIEEQEADPLIGSNLVERKVQVKVEPKVIFAAERTFFTWVRSALFLFGASMTVLKYSQHNPMRILYGALLLPLTLVFIIYPLITCKFVAIYYYPSEVTTVKSLFRNSLNSN